MHRMLFPAIALSVMALPALAEEAARYTLEKTAEGYVRMDTQTGVMSICKEQAEQLVCRLAADERDAYEGTINALAKRVEAVESRIAALEATSLKRPEALPSQEEFDKTLSMMERFLRRFMGVVEEFKGKEATPGTTPQKT